jgi:predicted DCC family thiol-disulfide oxidoreductase YuxK
MNDPVILFDGYCNLCNSTINYIIDHDPHAYFKLGSLQSEEAKIYLDKYNLGRNKFKTVVLIENKTVYTQSTAALKIAKRLYGPVKLLWIFILLPRFIRDPVYNWVARNRYKWFGKREQCRVATLELKSRFL